jgi:hypothetical protein
MDHTAFRTIVECNRLQPAHPAKSRAARADNSRQVSINRSYSGSDSLPSILLWSASHYVDMVGSG